MKNILAIVGLVALMAPVAHADESDFAATYMKPLVANTIGTLDLINWKVGDGANYNVTISSMPIPGTMVKSVTKDENDGTIWFNETIDLTIEKQSVDIQMSKADGKILQELVNGQAQTVDNTPPKIVSQDYTTITVVGGTFKAIHIVATSTEQGQPVQMEEWANPTATCMDGSLKAIVTTQGTTITEEMTSFKKN